LNLVLPITQIIIALGLLNVWLLRLKSKTSYRGGTATTLKEEFQVYGLPSWAYTVVGILKIGSALMLLAGIWIQPLVTPFAGLVTLLMVGAIVMHIKVKDPLIKSLPAAVMLVLSLIAVALSLSPPAI
jgi:hypothetical protein